jgi:hypothetical protein
MRFLKGQKNMKKVKWHKIAIEHLAPRYFEWVSLD